MRCTYCETLPGPDKRCRVSAGVDQTHMCWASRGSGVCNRDNRNGRLGLCPDCWLALAGPIPAPLASAGAPEPV